MPKPQKFSKFIVNPEYDERQDLVDTVAKVRDLLNNELACIDKIEDTTLQLIGIFSLIDRLAQEQANYPRDFKKVFFDFVLTHQKQCDYLERVEPITLYYRVEDIIEESVLIPGFPPEKEVSLDSLGYLYSETVKSVLTKGKAEEILDYIKKKKGTAFADAVAKDHQLISLMYRMRSKAVHEMSGLGESMNYHQELKPTEPYYRDLGRSYVQDGYWVTDDVVELVIPNIFIRNILQDCIEGYLSDCLRDNRFPFSNNHMTRKHVLSWYDK